MNSDTATRLVPLLVALQFAAFGWRINREITVGAEHRRTWFPLTDYINVISMVGATFLTIIYPLSLNRFTRVSKVAIAVGYVLIAFHPISMAGHYRLWGKEGRNIYTKQGKDYPWLTLQEAASVALSLILALASAWYVWRAP